MVSKTHLTQPGQLVSVREAAAILACSPATVRRRIHGGELQAVRLGSGGREALRLSRDALERWLRGDPPEVPAETRRLEPGQ